MMNLGFNEMVSIVMATECLLTHSFGSSPLENICDHWMNCVKTDIYGSPGMKRQLTFVIL